MTGRGPLLVVGASGRAAAASAIRAGYDPFVIDLFADADTQLLCPVLKCDPASYPHGFIELADRAPPGPWMYTGGLENYPDVVEAISRGRELFGNNADVLKLTRDERILGDKIRQRGGRYPETITRGAGPTDPGPWLRKPRRSSGGDGIRYATSEDFEHISKGMRDCLQKFVFGEPMSAIFRTEGIDNHRLFGLTRQLIGTPWLHAGGFRYAGNVSWHDPRVHAQMRGFGECLNGFGLQFVWGEDFIRRSQGPWTIEVNPRYTAAVEVLEQATAEAILAGDWPEPTYHFACVAKGIYYAPHTFAFPAYGPWEDSLARCTDVWTLHDFADIPQPGTRIEAGQPVVTIFAEGETEAECLQSLQRRAAELDRLFAVPPPPEPPCRP